MDVTITEQPELRIAGIRHIGPYQQIGKEFGRLGGLLKGPPPPGSQMIAVYHDDPAVTAPDHLRSEAAFTLPPNTHAPDGIVEQRVAAGRFARNLHKGSYEGLPATWDALKEWVPKNGQRMGYPSYELYLNNPMTTEKSELLTEVYVRLA